MKATPAKRTRGIRRYRALREAGLCTLCTTPVTDGKVCCPACREKRKQPKKDAPIRTTCFSGPFCIIPLSEALEVLRLKIEYQHEFYQFTGSRSFQAKRAGITPFDALRAKGLLNPERFEPKVAAYRQAVKESNKPEKPRMCRVDNGECESEEGA